MTQQLPQGRFLALWRHHLDTFALSPIATLAQHLDGEGQLLGEPSELASGEYPGRTLAAYDEVQLLRTDTAGTIDQIGRFDAPGANHASVAVLEDRIAVACELSTDQHRSKGIRAHLESNTGAVATQSHSGAGGGEGGEYSSPSSSALSAGVMSAASISLRASSGSSANQ